MSKRSERISDGISQLSRTTYVPDCRDIIRAYLKSVGHNQRHIGETPVFVLRRKNRVVLVAGSPEALQLKPADVIGAGRNGGIKSVRCVE